MKQVNAIAAEFFNQAKEMQENRTIYARMAEKFSKVEFRGKTYALSAQAELTNRVFPGWWGDAAEGEEYTQEWSAPAMDTDGNECVVRWQFEVVRGEETEDDSLHDWDDVQSVQAA